MAAAADDWMLS